MSEKNSHPAEGPIIREIRQSAHVELPLPHANELPIEEKRAAVRGALALKLELADIYDAKVEEVVQAGRASREVADELYKLALAHTGVMLDYVDVLVGFEGNHGTGIEIEEVNREE